MLAVWEPAILTLIGSYNSRASDYTLSQKISSEEKRRFIQTAVIDCTRR